ncbi:Plasmodium exported protein, unknown function [Plasmodium ovale wallikeri]|uniref:Pv-fam-d protein n=2 Tax=Plasmodium ovale TaxID=36330 RepID=A0A1A9AIY6_PLAOA|nr:Plasmodium exported protein, unknown function [Plasmodium ovale wallikeri]SBT56160.1 Plasmodium exported protein, unknown function [Plasmodium ovale wallikeri]SBT74014.1 Plasmodium exported protein, unknown function [Plasmodium ovale]
MLEKTNKYIPYFNALTIALLTWTSHYSNESTAFNVSVDREFNLSTPFDARTSRVLRGETQFLNMQSSSTLKEKIKELLNEGDDKNFADRLNSLLNEENSGTHFNSLKVKNSVQGINAQNKYSSLKKNSKESKYVDEQEEEEDVDYIDDIDDAEQDDVYMDDLVYDDHDDIDLEDESHYYERRNAPLKRRNHYMKNVKTPKRDRVYEKELDRFNDAYINRKLAYRKKSILYPFVKFIKKSDAMYETDLVKLLSTEYNNNHRGESNFLKRLQMHFKASTPLLAATLFIITFIVLESPVGIAISSGVYVLALIYVLYKLMKCSSICKNNRKQKLRTKF